MTVTAIRDERAEAVRQLVRETDDMCKSDDHVEGMVMLITKDGVAHWSWTACSDIPRAVGLIEVFKQKMLHRMFVSND